MLTLTHYLFPAIAAILLALALAAKNPIQRKAFFRTGLIFAIVSAALWLYR